MNTPLEFYKKLLAYDDELDLDKPSPLTHKGVIHLMTEYSNQLNKPVVMQDLPIAFTIYNKAHALNRVEFIYWWKEKLGKATVGNSAEGKGVSDGLFPVCPVCNGKYEHHYSCDLNNESA
jgi:hypothetical protein